MGDIGKGKQVTSYPAALDTDTPLANCAGTPCIGGDAVVAEYINSPSGAIVAIETVLGITPQGTAASVAARLAIMLANDGGMPRGTIFPAAPVNVPQLFYRTDQNVVYFYNTAAGSWVQLLTASALSAFVPIASPVTITAQHTFNPSIAEAPFVLGANALAQKVIGLKADTVASNPDTAGVANGVATLTAGLQVVQDAQTVGGKAPAVANGLATLGASSRLVQAAIAVFDGTGDRQPANSSTPNALVEGNSLGYLDPSWSGAALAKTANYTVSTGDSVISLDATGGSFTLTFPAASTMSRQIVTLIKTTAANIVTLAGTFLGASSVILFDQFETLRLYSDGTSWNFLKPKYPKAASANFTLGFVTTSAVQIPLSFGGTGITHQYFDTNNNFAGAAQVCAISIATPAVVSLTGHGYKAGQEIVFATTGALPTGITVGTKYYIISAGFGANSFEISATASLTGAAVNTSGSQSGVQSVFAFDRFTPSVAGYYLITGSALATDATTLTLFDIQVVKNGNTVLGESEIQSSLSVGTDILSVSSVAVFMNGTTDFIELLGQINGTGALTLTGEFFSAVRTA